MGEFPQVGAAKGQSTAQGSVRCVAGVEIQAHRRRLFAVFVNSDVEIPARPFLPIRNGQVDLPEWERQILDSIAWTLEDSLR